MHERLKCEYVMVRHRRGSPMSEAVKSSVSVFFVGPALAVVGWLMAQTWGVLWPAVCVGVGIGMITLYADSDAATRAFVRVLSHRIWSSRGALTCGASFR
jgi:hypothetical protein